MYLQSSTLMRTALMLAVLCLQPITALAAVPFQRVGVIDRVDAQQQTIVISDVMYILPASVRIYLFEAQADNPKEPPKERQPTTQIPLRHGMRIGFKADGEGPGRRGSIVEVWILPRAGFKQVTE
jgi:hypothetical protein